MGISGPVVPIVRTGWPCLNAWQSAETRNVSIRIAVANVPLARALLTRVTGAMNGISVSADGMFGSVGPGDVLVTTPTDCSAVECHLLAQQGTAVIVLAPVIREFDRARYLEAGATAYIAMQIDTADLVAAIRGALGERVPMVPIRPVCRAANPM